MTSWLILQNGTSNVGLFQGTFEKKIHTFNPGWKPSGRPLSKFEDDREIQQVFMGRGIAQTTETDLSLTVPPSVILLDLDGNPIPIDPHVARSGTQAAGPLRGLAAAQALERCRFRRYGLTGASKADAAEQGGNGEPASWPG
jgi:hypothetical protein